MTPLGRRAFLAGTIGASTGVLAACATGGGEAPAQAPTDLAPLLAAPAWDTPGKTVGDTLLAGATNTLMFEGKKHGGNEVMKHIDNLEDGAWQQDAVRAVAEAVVEIKTRKMLLPGTAGLTHIQAQAAWLRHKAAIIPCGSWLKNEMKSQVPADFEMLIAPTPSLDTSDQIPFDAINNGPGEDFIVPAQAKNVPGGLELLRIMMSVEGARKFAELTHTLTVVADAHDDQNEDPIIVSSNERLPAAKKVEALDNAMYPTWYPSLYEEASAAAGVLLTGNLDAKGFVDRIQKYADKVKKDPKIKKFSR